MNRHDTLDALAYVLTVAPWLEEHGVRQKPRSLPDEHAHLLGEWRQCFMNAGRIALLDKTLRYTEGLLYEGELAIPHAWLTDSGGLVVEPTPRDRISDGYFGVTMTAVEAAEGRYAYAGRGGYWDPALPGLITLGWDGTEVPA